jgi:hypothetical protein
MRKLCLAASLVPVLMFAGACAGAGAPAARPADCASPSSGPSSSAYCGPGLAPARVR